jgi:hypothetical protein
VTAQELLCRRDGTPTRLTCAGCGTGICPKCMVRTAVGFKCPTCVGGQAGRRRRPRSTVVAVAVIAVLAAAVYVLRPGAGSTPSPTPTAAGATATPTAQAMIGEDARDGQVTFVVDDLACGSKQLQAGGATRSAEGTFCLLRLTARNTSGGPAVLLGRFQYLLDGRSKSYGPDLALSQALSGGTGQSLSEVTLNPDITVSMVLVYDVPDTLDPVEAQLRGTGQSRFGVRVRLQRRPGQ